MLGLRAAHVSWRVRAVFCSLAWRPLDGFCSVSLRGLCPGSGRAALFLELVCVTSKPCFIALFAVLSGQLRACVGVYFASWLGLPLSFARSAVSGYAAACLGIPLARARLFQLPRVAGAARLEQPGVDVPMWHASSSRSFGGARCVSVHIGHYLQETWLIFTLWLVDPSLRWCAAYPAIFRQCMLRVIPHTTGREVTIMT